MSLIYLQDYATHHPLVHHPLKTHYGSNMDEPRLSKQDSTFVTYCVNPPTSFFFPLT
jgi:hypothetical protein